MYWLQIWSWCWWCGVMWQMCITKPNQAFSGDDCGNGGVGVDDGDDFFGVELLLRKIGGCPLVFFGVFVFVFLLLVFLVLVFWCWCWCGVVAAENWWLPPGSPDTPIPPHTTLYSVLCVIMFVCFWYSDYPFLLIDICRLIPGTLEYFNILIISCKINAWISGYLLNVEISYHTCRDFRLLLIFVKTTSRVLFPSWWNFSTENMKRSAFDKQKK